MQRSAHSHSRVSWQCVTTVRRRWSIHTCIDCS